MSIISPFIDNHHQIRQSIRQRQIVDSNERISSGNRFNDSQSGDPGSLRISTRLEVENKFSHSTKKNLENAYILAQYQADVMHSADNVLGRMNDLAYQATDIMTSNNQREVLDTEFKSLSGQLTDLLFDRTFGKVLFDPLASENIKTFNSGPKKTGSAARVEEPSIDLGALSAKVKLWWDPMYVRDRFQIYVGGKRIFDTGEYRSNVGGTRSETVSDVPQYDGSGNKILDSNGDHIFQSQVIDGDYFEIDFGPGTIGVQEGTDSNPNHGNSGDAGDFSSYGYEPNHYIFTDAPVGDSSVIQFVINDEGPEGITKSPNTLWDRFYKIEAKELIGPKGIKNEKGELLEIQPVGFATMSDQDLLSRENASVALTKTRDEIKSLQTQLYTLAKTFSEIKFGIERVESRSRTQQTSLGKIKDADVASEYTKLAKNLIVQEATNHAMVHSRVSAANTFNLLM